MIENKSVSNPPNKPRPIDKIRNGALSIDINTPDDNSPISEMISAGERMLIVKGKGIYEAMLADQVDPERTNIATPNTVQRILPYGADAAWVGATLLTAYQLFKNSSAQDTVDGDEAIAIVLEIVEDISGAHQLRDSYVKAETEATADLDPKIRSDRSIMLPAVGNVETRCNEFLQKEIMRYENCFGSCACSIQMSTLVVGKASKRRLIVNHRALITFQIPGGCASLSPVNSKCPKLR